jgi:hypothetical protein
MVSSRYYQMGLSWQRLFLGRLPAGIVLIAVLVFYVAFFENRKGLFFVIVGVWMLVFIGRELAWRSAIKVARQAIVNGGRTCDGCRFDLVGSPPAGQCPECGRRYSVDELRMTWGKFETWLMFHRFHWW